MKRLIIALCLSASAVFAVQPDEILDDPVLEARARELSKGLRCLVCQNENIDESNAALARDLRILLRERLTSGDSDEQAVEFLVARYGEFVLLKPTTSGANLILWVAGPAGLAIALLLGGLYIRRRSRPTMPDALSDEEEARLKEILKE